MKKFGVLFVTTLLFVNGHGQTGWESYGRNIQNYGQNFANYGQELARYWQNQAMIIQQKAERQVREKERQVEQARREQKTRQEEFQKEQDEIMEIVKQIQAGKTPQGVNSANTTSITENVNGKMMTITNTIYSIGNEKKGAIHTVQIVYEGEKVTEWSINSMIWNGDQLNKKLIQHTPHSGNNNGRIISTSGSGGSTITSSNGDSTVVLS